MNYYNPYYYMMNPMNGLYSTPSVSRGLFSRLANGFNWSSLLNNTQRTLGIINQAIPLVRQASPMLQNAKTMFRVMNEFKKVDSPTPTTTPTKTPTNTISETKDTNTTNNTNYIVPNSGPTFFQ